MASPQGDAIIRFWKLHLHKPCADFIALELRPKVGDSGSLHRICDSVSIHPLIQNMQRMADQHFAILKVHHVNGT